MEGKDNDKTDYRFRVSILNEDGSVDTSYNQINGDDEFVNGATEFVLKAKEQKMFWGFEVGTRYKVEELTTGGFTTKVTYGTTTEENTTSHIGELSTDTETIVFTNTYVTKKEYSVKKTWGNEQQPPEGAAVVIKLGASVTGEENEEIDLTDEELIALSGLDSLEITLTGGTEYGDDTEDLPWEYTWENLPKLDSTGREITYKAAETEYRINNESIPIDGEDGLKPTSGTDENGVLIITNQIPVVSKKAKKTWGNGQQPPVGAIITLSISAVQENNIDIPASLDNEISPNTVVLNGGMTGGDDTAEEPWEYEWTDLPKYDLNGKAIRYVVEETEYMIEDETVSLPLPTSTDEPAGYDYYFTNLIPTTEIEVEKQWSDEQWSENTTVEMTLQSKAGEAAEFTTADVEDPVIVLNGNPSNYQWSGLSMYDENGNKITYQVVETKIMANDKVYTPGGKAYTEDGEEKEPDGAIEDVYVVDGPVESDLENDDGEIIGKKFTITNTQATTEIEVDKVWANADGTSDWPEGVTVEIQLTADGNPVSGKTATLSADKPSYKFEKLVKYQADGETEIAYSVEEVEIAGYASEVGDLTDGKVTITNTQETTEIEVDKVWANADGTTDWPEGVTVEIQLTADGEPVNGKTATLSADKPSYKFEKLVKYQADGETEIAYSVEEVEIAGYASNVGDLTDGKITVTNTQEVGSLNLIKSILVNNAESNATRTFYVRVSHVDQNGETWYVTDSNGTLSKTAPEGDARLSVVPGTATTIDNLPIGNYTIEEYTENDDIALSGLSFVDALSSTNVSATIRASEETTASLVNHYTPDKYCIAVTKQWLVNGEVSVPDEQELTVRLQRKTAKDSDWQPVTGIYMGDTVTGNDPDEEGRVDEIILNKENNWSAVAVGQDQVDENGDRYSYRWVEEAVDGWAEGTHEEIQATTKDGATLIFLTKLNNSKATYTPVVQKVVLDENGDEYETEKPFEFSIASAQPLNAPLPEPASATVNGSGEGAFGEITYTAAGQYVYIIQEVKPESGDPTEGIEYSKEKITLTVNVEQDKSNGALSIGSVKYTGGTNQDNRITNTYHVEPAKAVFSGEKTVVIPEGTEVAEREFTIALYKTGADFDTEGTNAGVMQTRTIGSKADDKSFTFDEIQYEGIGAVGTYYYVIREVYDAEDTAGWTYDANEYRITVEVTDKGAGQLLANQETEHEIKNQNFRNQYEVTEIQITKAWADGENANGFRPTAEEFRSYLKLYADDAEKTDAEISIDSTDENNWIIRAGKLPKYNDKGQEISYRFEEDLAALNKAIQDKYGVAGAYTVIPAEGKAAQGGILTNINLPARYCVAVTKVWEDDNNRDGLQPKSIEVSLLADGTAYKADGQEVKVTLNKDNNWTAMVRGVPRYKDGKAIVYTWSEVLNEDISGNYKVTVTPLDEEQILTDSEGHTESAYVTVITNTHDIKLTEAEVEKEWKGVDFLKADELKEIKVTIQLQATYKDTEGKDITAVVDTITLPTAEGKWSYKWTKLPKNINLTGENKDKQEITYTVEEINVPAWFQKTNEGNRITNTLPTGDLKVTKNVISTQEAWDDTEFTFTIDLKWGEGTQQISLDAGKYANVTVNNGVFTLKKGETATFAGLPAGTRYTVNEAAEGENGYVAGFVTLSDNAEGTILPAEAGKESTISATFTNIKEEGSLIVAKTVISPLQADKDAAYQFVITLDDNSFNGSLKAAINGEAVNDVVFTAGETKSTANITLHDGKVMVITGLPKDTVWTVAETGADGNTFTVYHDKALKANEIAAVNGEYIIGGTKDSVINGKETATAHFVNERRSGSLTLKKTYAEDSLTVQGDEEAIYEFTVQLTDAKGNPISGNFGGYSFNTEGKTRVWVKADGTDSVTITGIPVGTQYQITEELDGALGAMFENVTLGGSIEINNNTNNNVTVIAENRRKTGELQIRKTINGGGNVDFSGLRFIVTGPNGYNRTLLYGRDFDQKTGICSLTNLEPGDYVVYEDNAGRISTQVTLNAAVSVTAMRANVTANNSNSIPVINLINDYEPANTSVMVIKIWDDMDNLDGTRPGSITMTLSNGQTVTLDAGNNWMAEVRNLPLYDANGNVIYYTWTEAAVPGYIQDNVTILGNTTVFTNRHQPDITSTSVTKVWDDNNNSMGLRPATLRVTLSPGGRSYTLSDANNWTVTVENLPKFYNGQEITYTWSEQTVLGYTSDVRVVDNVTVFTNHYRITPPGPPEEPGQPGRPRLPGTPVYVFEDYNTPLGVEVIINHVGDCFD